MNHILVFGIAALIAIVLAVQLLVRIPKSTASARQLVAHSSPLQLVGVVFNCCLGLVYLGLGLWMLGRNFSQDAAVYLPHWWLVALSQGFSLILISIAFSIKAQFLGATSVRIWSVLLTIYAAFICCSSVVNMVAEKVVTMKGCLDVLLLPGECSRILYSAK
jgi:ATP-binding cassette subfamily C (CFTR/MRP) protein 2